MCDWTACEGGEISAMWPSRNELVFPCIWITENPFQTTSLCVWPSINFPHLEHKKQTQYEKRSPHDGEFENVVHFASWCLYSEIHIFLFPINFLHNYCLCQTYECCSLCRRKKIKNEQQLWNLSENLMHAWKTLTTLLNSNVATEVQSIGQILAHAGVATFFWAPLYPCAIFERPLVCRPLNCCQAYTPSAVRDCWKKEGRVAHKNYARLRSKSKLWREERRREKNIAPPFDLWACTRARPSGSSRAPAWRHGRKRELPIVHR